MLQRSALGAVQHERDLPGVTLAAAWENFRTHQAGNMGR
jgi:hypothetical protein